MVQFRYQSATVPKILNDTDTDTYFRYKIFPILIPVLFFGTKFFRYRFRDFFFPISTFTDTGSETFSGTKLFCYRFWYHQKSEKFPVPVRNENQGFIFDTSSETFYAVCEDTQNLNKTESETFSDTESDTFFDTKFVQYRIRK